MSENDFTHFDEKGRGRMVDVTGKPVTFRQATAQARVYMREETMSRIKEGKVAKGDVLSVAQVAGVMGVKQTPFLIPMCHPLQVTGVDFDFSFEESPNCLVIETTVRLQGQTGVEMEALTAASVAALTVYDMCKAIDKKMEIGSIRLLEKKGGKSGHFINREMES